MLFHHHLQPLFGDVGFEAGDLRHALEVFAERPVELVVVCFVLDQAGAGEEVEIVDRIPRDMLLQRLQQREELARGNGKFLCLEVRKKSISMESRRWRDGLLTSFSGSGAP
jgi:hypothetical protein